MALFASLSAHGRRFGAHLKTFWGASITDVFPVSANGWLLGRLFATMTAWLPTALSRRCSIAGPSANSLPSPFDDDTVATLETVAQHAASSQYLNDWSAVRVKDPALKKRMSEIGRQPYIAEAPLLYVFVADEHRNAIIAESKGVSTDSDTYGLAGSYRFSQAQNDAVLALHAMETAAYSLGLGCVILGSLLNDVPGLIEALHLPQYTYPVLGLAIGKPDQAPALKPRMPRELQFFDDVYPSDDDATESIKERIGAFDVSVHEYYDLRNTDRPVDAFSDQIASIAAQRMDATHQVIPNATSQGFRLDR